MFKKKNLDFYRAMLYWGGLILVLLVVDLRIINLNYIVTKGRTVLVPLYFAERSDFDGNGHMRLRYENIIPDTNFNHNQGVIVVSNDINKVAIYSRFYDEQMPVEVGEFLLKYEVRRPPGFFDTSGLVKVAFGAESFHFKEEGLSEYYLRTRYAILKLAEDGTSILYGLADMTYQELGRSF